MKIVIIILAMLTLLIWIGAGIRLASATKDTEPLISYRADKDAVEAVSAPQPKIGETGKSGALVEHLRGGRLSEMEQTSSIATSNPQASTDYNGNKAMESAERITDKREEQLGDAKKKIKILKKKTRTT